MPRASFAAFGLDAALKALVADVLTEVGLRAAEPGRADVVLTTFDGSRPMGELLREARAASGAERVVVILPIEASGLAEVAMGCGAAGAFTLGTSLKRLEAAVLRAVWRAAGEREAPAESP